MCFIKLFNSRLKLQKQLPPDKTATFFSDQYKYVGSVQMYVTIEAVVVTPEINVHAGPYSAGG